MTKKEIMAYKRAAKEACAAYGIKVYMTNMILLESGNQGSIIDYVLFRDKATGVEYSCAYGPAYYNMERDTLWNVQAINQAANEEPTEEQPAAARYMEQVEQADSLDELDSITETAANDETISTVEYETIHAAALRKAQEWDPQNQQEAPSRPMYKTIPEALAIFDELDPASVHTITEDVRGETMTGTPAELVRRIIEQDEETGGNISHGATTTEGWAIIETAYALLGGEAIITDDGRHVWSRRKQ